VEETAIGATIVKKQYDALCDDGKHDVMISTCCHSINLLDRETLSRRGQIWRRCPFADAGPWQRSQKRHPGCKVIFVGPCISKKNEIEMYPDYVDCVLTFLELEKWLSENKIEVAEDSTPKANPESRARLFPTEGGILDTMERDNPNFTYLSVGGMDECIAALKDILSGKVHHAFIEMSSCSGSCINGPAISPKARAVVSAYLAIHHSAGERDFKVSAYSYEELKKAMPAFSVKDVEPSEEQIRSVLAQIGKTSPKDELNCSSCGYPSCREKAIAVIKGKASLEMCLPFLMEKAKSFSNQIVEGSDNAILVVNENFQIQLANKALASLVNVARAKDLIGKPLSSILEEDLFSLALGGTPIKGKKLALPEYGKCVEATLSL
jgi:hypothetical protein